MDPLTGGRSHLMEAGAVGGRLHHVGSRGGRGHERLPRVIQRLHGHQLLRERDKIVRRRLPHRRRPEERGQGAVLGPRREPRVQQRLPRAQLLL